ncbi:hypothetical protein, partial [Clavibacter michiganensis]|uniref:hypothetical protein n=1 Tax=Clavibacter michiganensis TaxID=28447 RepID=UPI001CA4F8A2
DVAQLRRVHERVVGGEDGAAGEAVVRTLELLGVDDIFGLPGGGVGRAGMGARFLGEGAEGEEGVIP